MKEIATGGVLPYMTHLMNDARETIQIRDKRIADLEAALVALIDAVDAKDPAAIDRALFVGRGLTF